MDENYLNIVRKSLYGEAKESNVKSTGKMPRKEKKIRFAIDHYNSETVFKKKEKPDKAKNRKKRKAAPIQNSDSSFDGETSSSSLKIKNRKATPKKITPKKRKMVISFSSDSFDEEVKDNNIFSPSKSEIEFLQSAFKKPNEKINVGIESSDSEENINQFNLDNFFNTYEHSLNESVTEAHAGIENEFESDDMRNVNIISSNQNSRALDVEEPIESGESIVVISDGEINNISDDVMERNISEVADKIRESIIVDDEDENSPISIPESPQQDNNYIEEYIAADFYNLEDCILAVLKENRSVSIYGLLRVEVLYGKVDLFGSILDKTSKGINLYSPRGSALLRLINLTTEDTEEDNIYDILSLYLSTETLRDMVATKKCAIVKCTKLEDLRILFLEKYISQQIFPKHDNPNLPRVVFQPSGGWNIIKESYAWCEFFNDIKPSTKLMLAGGKGVGKSTLLRYAINKLLNVFDKIRVIDLDPGQSEFAVPGCVSIVTVEDHVFGPNYTHLKTTDRSFLSNINVGPNPQRYIQCVQSLMAYYNTLDNYPTLINYMGFTQGIGLKIISSVITYLQPTDIIQIQSKHNSKNFARDLTHEVVQENCDLFMSNAGILEYNLHKIQAMNDDNEGWSLEPRQSREMCVLAYLGQMMKDGVNSLMSHKLPMHEIKLSSIKITNLEGEEIPPATINAALVALCCLEESSTILVCLGYGVVRGMDLESDILVLLTPESSSVLEEVSHLILGNVNLPPSVYMTPDGVQGTIPYVMQGELISLGQITKRTYLPMNKK